jgi:hypothetical protein
MITEVKRHEGTRPTDRLRKKIRQKGKWYIQNDGVMCSGQRPPGKINTQSTPLTLAAKYTEWITNPAGKKRRKMGSNP